jgi:hypothetical protein
MRTLMLILAAGFLVVGRIGLAQPIRADSAFGDPIVTCVDGTSFGIKTSVNGLCDAGGGVEGYQNLAFVCNDGSIVQDPAAQNVCSDHQGIELRVDQPQDVASVGSPRSIGGGGPVPVFPTNR